jgi:hypothetical protein
MSFDEQARRFAGFFVAWQNFVAVTELTKPPARRISMGSFKDPTFADRIDAAAKAKQALLERFRTPINDPERLARQAERMRLANERAAVKRAREAEKAAKKAQEAELAAQAAREAAEAAARELEEKKAQEEALLAQQKAARDARYAARKKRNKR